MEESEVTEALNTKSDQDTNAVNCRNSGSESSLIVLFDIKARPQSLKMESLLAEIMKGCYE